ncbi:AAA family ATPase [Bacillus cereus]|uniref:AAA family ATPase n=1 Tax=Bacillus cereus TaxID=1396 RepID=UPI001560DD04|nr:AAA family ATPase [Bacillus cereus]QKH05970.1 AAA family ATPase [Bacillus cereus]QKH15941.1 AAA family ATPase [Bacillus cereus]
MKLILIFGPQAVGKMTVGQELATLTGLKLFHNHMTIDLVSPIFDYSTKEAKRLVSLFRNEIFEEVSKSDLSGMIFTYIWAFDLQADWDYIHHVESIFESKGGTVYFVELEAELDERLEHKPKKRDIEWSENNLKETMKKHRLNSLHGEIEKEEYIKINNTYLSAKEVAEMIKEKFQL